jgi:ABC-type multidrug transport system fused ATPase/permease subunit
MRGLMSFRGLPGEARAALARLVATGLAQALAAALVAQAVGVLFTQAAAGGAVPFAPLGALALAAAITVWLRFRERIDGERLGQAIAHDTRARLASHLVRMPAAAAGPDPGAIVLRFTGDLGAIRTWYAGGVAALAAGGPVLVGGLVGLALLDARLAAVLFALLAASLLVQWRLASGLRRTGEEAARRRGRLARTVAERAGALSSIQAFGRGGSEARKIEGRSADLAEAMVARAAWAGGMRATTEWAAAGLPFVAFALWAVTGSADPAAIAATFAVGGLIAPRIRELGRVREALELARVSRDRVERFLRTGTLDERSEAKRLMRREGMIALRSVGAGGAFAGFSAEAPAGARVALVGPNGAGKTRLLGLIAGLEEPAAGTVVLDRQNATGRQLASLRKLVALAGAGMPLVKGSVDYNIRYGARLDGDAAEAALALGGYEELLADIGRTGAGSADAQELSLGQKARVALLRALMRGPLVLLLDEIDAHLDAAGGAVLARVFAGFRGTIVMATHDPDWIGRCDTVWTLGGEGTAGRLRPAFVEED